MGTFSVFIQHTSASLSINENADPTVRTDMEKALNMLVPESWATDGLLDHVDEGPDDITGHVKSTIVGANLTIPVSNGRLALGNWQGIYLCEHRNAGGFGGGHARRLVITVQGLLSSSAHKK
ncbi:hypothetical protein NSK_003581 [Nannochloropsis salina CCMP1776]|uniref:Secondary thiamine-phosphate synthase enzyme n=1 Tax=Nannochloropsis salina CCMP1776 TaxID=1027361 RepID=A0A4D9D943_9STRA|nr:hypothetical protein NSK_003581 [Nannochloropsis salina CCMP1776]|eukprot:TFJ85158.1 hypothetical protein NSK_003581 [Nannochloropsis salina CCMP1776]